MSNDRLMHFSSFLAAKDRQQADSVQHPARPRAETANLSRSIESIIDRYPAIMKRLAE